MCPWDLHGTKPQIDGSDALPRLAAPAYIQGAPLDAPTDPARLANSCPRAGPAVPHGPGGGGLRSVHVRFALSLLLSIRGDGINGKGPQGPCLRSASGARGRYHLHSAISCFDTADLS